MGLSIGVISHSGRQPPFANPHIRDTSTPNLLIALPTKAEPTAPSRNTVVQFGKDLHEPFLKGTVAFKNWSRLL